ncbi:MAG TPA: class I SAM-dependent methyltransferase [Thermoplasmata archaeon]|nr:class I SAM-dependent methyltransferase [Thermoplasmata archaeon]
MIATGPSQEIVDYRRFDFAGLWTGRDQVSEVERSVLRQSLNSFDGRRILEVGTGFGRLLGTLTGIGREVVATDLDAEALGRIPAPRDSGRVLRVASNLYHLPFVDGAFTGATLVRVHHHLLDPVGAMREVGRVLRVGSPLVVSYQPRPSVATLVNDVQRALGRKEDGPGPSVTFARGPVVLPARPFPIRSVRRKGFREEARDAGFELTREIGTGFEEFAPLRRLPSESFVRIGTALGRAPAFPTRFSVLSKRSGTNADPLPDIGSILACPRCGTPRPEWSQGAPLACGKCSFKGGRRDGVLDLRFVPPGIHRWEADP